MHWVGFDQCGFSDDNSTGNVCTGPAGKDGDSYCDANQKVETCQQSGSTHKWILTSPAVSCVSKLPYCSNPTATLGTVLCLNNGATGDHYTTCSMNANGNGIPGQPGWWVPGNAQRCNPSSSPSPSTPAPYLNGQCGSCSGCYAPNADPNSTACAIINGVCSKAGYCASSTTSTNEGAHVYCQDGNGPQYPLPGIIVHLTGHDEYDSGTTNYPSQTTGSDGRVMFTGLSTYPNQWFEGLLFPNGWGTGNHPFANSPQYANLLVPGTNQKYSLLVVGDTHNSMFDNCATTSSAWNCSGLYVGQTCSSYCSPDPTLPADTTKLPQNWNTNTVSVWGRGVPSRYTAQDYKAGNYNMTYHFSNCTPSSIQVGR